MKNFVNFPEDEDEQLHTYYRALDYLCKAKGQIEKQLYYRLLGYGLDNSLILYDITSTYFEGEQAEIGKKGFSRDRRGDLDQIVVGLVMSRDGIPIAHHVFEGNRLDKTTVQEVVEDLKERFGIKKAIIVGDRGMITVKNIEMIKGQEYEYILGLQKRNRKVVDHLLEKVLKNPEDPLQEFGYSDLSPVLQKKYRKEVRFIAGYNKEVAKKTGRKRDRNIASFRKIIEEARLYRRSLALRTESRFDQVFLFHAVVLFKLWVPEALLHDLPGKILMHRVLLSYHLRVFRAISRY